MLGRFIRWLQSRENRQEARLLPESRVVVAADESGLSVTQADGSAQTIRWDDLTRIVILTNESGPFGTDLWWVLEGRDGRCSYPQGAAGEKQVMDAYEARLPGFDWEAVIKASGSATGGTFVCWSRTDAG